MISFRHDTGDLTDDKQNTAQYYLRQRTLLIRHRKDTAAFFTPVDILGQYRFANTFDHPDVRFDLTADRLHLRQQLGVILSRQTQLLRSIGYRRRRNTRQFVDRFFHFSSTVGTAQIFQQIDLTCKIKGHRPAARHHFYIRFYGSTDLTNRRQQPLMIFGRQTQLFRHKTDRGIFHPR